MILKQTDKTRKELQLLKEPFDDLVVRLVNIAHEQGISVQVLKAKGFSCKFCLQNKEGKIYNNARSFEKLWELANRLNLVEEGLTRTSESEYKWKRSK